MEREHLIDLLLSALQSVDPNEERVQQYVKQARAGTLSEALHSLAFAERATKTASGMRLIATAKAVLQGRRSDDEFVRLCDQATGL